MATVAELLKIDHKMNSLTMTELQVALLTAQKFPAIKKNSAIMASITTALAAITAYNAYVLVTNIIQKATPAIKLATKAAAIPLNPSMSGEIAQDTLQIAQGILPPVIQSGVTTAKDKVFNTEVPGT